MRVILKKGKIEEIDPLDPNSPRKVDIEETPLDFDSFQISYNSWGHIKIKGFNSKTSSPNEFEIEINDVLIIFDEKESKKLLNFIKKFKEVE